MRRLLVILTCALGLPACATITTGTSQAISVMTDPPEAACQLQRGGETIGVVNPTPGTVQVSKSIRDIEIQCTRRGYQPALATVSSQFQPMYVGNVLIGGLIGMTVDLASGAGAYYQPSATVALRRAEPEPSPSLPDGPAWPPLAAVSPMAPTSVAASVASGAPSEQSLEDRVAAVRADCRRARRRDCDGEVEAFLQAVEEQRQRDIAVRLRRGAM